MLRTQPSFVGIALHRLRFSILVCCWVLGLSLMTHIGVWIAATFTDVRYEAVRSMTVPATIVTSTQRQNQPEAAVAGGVEAAEAPAMHQAAKEAADPNRVLSKYDRMMSMATRLASGAGLLALITLLPLMILGVLLAASSATPGVEQTVSSFTWTVLLALLVLPISEFVGLPWREGALFSYNTLTSQLEAATTKGATDFSMTFYARFAMLPFACLIGVGMIGLRFCAGIDAALPKKEDMRLDPALEREAGNITPTSLHGGRAGAALRAAAPLQPTASASSPHPAGMTVPSAGVAPKRLI